MCTMKGRAARLDSSHQTTNTNQIQLPAYGAQDFLSLSGGLEFHLVALKRVFLSDLFLPLASPGKNQTVSYRELKIVDGEFPARTQKSDIQGGPPRANCTFNGDHGHSKTVGQGKLSRNLNSDPGKSLTALFFIVSVPSCWPICTSLI